MSESTSSQEPIAEEYPIAAGVLFGGGAYVAGIAITFLLVLFDSGIRQEARSIGASLLESMLWTYNRAHFVDVTLSPNNPGVGATSIDVIATLSTSLGILTYLVPIVVLLCAGYFVAAKGEPTTIGQAVPFGALVFLGYLPLAVIGALLARTRVTVGTGSRMAEVVELTNQFMATVRMDPGLVAIQVGLVYPIVLGAIGGAIYYYHRERNAA